MQANYKNNDQAQMLRQLAQPQSNAPPTVDSEVSAIVNRSVEHAPKVILISELPSLQGALPLSLHLARQLNDRQPGTLLVDLAPAASRLPNTIAATAESFSGWESKVQPLWTTSTHGRTLQNWTETFSSGNVSTETPVPSFLPQVDILAQPAGGLPSIEQMPRLCEQLVRQIANQGRNGSNKAGTYETVLLLSECIGVPLDSVCWQAADIVILLHDDDSDADQLHSILAARIVMTSHGQRVILMRKRVPSLRDWTARRRIQLRDDTAQAVHQLLPVAECWDIVWPHVSNRLSRSMRATAIELADHILPAAVAPRRSRQAS